MTHKDKEFELDELKWVRVFTPVHIPKYLIDQIKHKEFTSDQFIRTLEGLCLIQGKNGMELNPLCHLYVLATPDNVVEGFLWFTIDTLSNSAIINNFSVDKKYWMRGKAVRRLAILMKEVIKKLQLNKVYWLTEYPRHSEWYGFKESTSKLMEYDPKDEEENKKNDKLKDKEKSIEEVNHG
ncbi:MAG: hypothetical protein R3230_01180 [Nitrosopumilaceae archaeon]|nr:hypothetical protein [Nitrosopumilaceae archaeon]